MAGGQEGRIQLKEAKGNRQNILNLYYQRTDCYVNDRLSILWEVKLLIKEGKIEPGWSMQLGSVISSEQGYLGFTEQGEAHYPYKADFIAEFNHVLEQMKQNGQIDAIVTKYLNEP